ncbi:pyridine nucleotide-disulfide oxidoreductase [Mesorhizobium tianshanense]|uniref:NADH dehydrogenase FAD-containing subunit n=1 Tax=Mesorhizobium tianshanense TaxID=39844 RepID=A0A562P409_9HYPH|nr:FAD-dependent oxidoreductase [Mesorhizobium tianshanense]TWI38726.1 NADH dehydrogenase FAD-containing subunit [Mesorhizobium tianshanense]GLS36660.1 pyridine nucleotide-disulfide oxidoreductase [Mesorhizobium tianshanense]
MNKRVVLVGAGHAHLHLLKNVASLIRLRSDVTIVAPDDFWYSGMATAMLAGLVSPDEVRVEIASLVAGTGAVFCRASMIGLDKDAREVVLDNGQRLAFDLLSLNLGSRPPPLPAQGQVVYSVKPVRSLVELRRRIEQAWQSPGSDVLRVAIVGGGVTGVEVAANLRALADLHRQRMQISIYNRSEPLKQLPHGAAAALLRHVRRSGIEVRWPVTVTMAGEGGVHFDDGTSDDCDVVISATGLVPPDLTRRLGLPTSGDGALVVDEYLRSAGDALIFAAGDCVAFDGFSLPRVGVYAVRQAPVLLANLCATLCDTPLTEFAPQRRFLSIIGLGHTSALMQRGPLWFKGPPALWLKRWIDHRFVEGYRT